MSTTVTKTEKPADRGRLVLATGSVVPVPAESVAQATAHYDATLKATVPVVSSFVLTD